MTSSDPPAAQETKRPIQLIPGVEPLPPGIEVSISADELRSKSLSELKAFAQELGISLAGLEDKASAVLTRLMQHAVEIEPGEV